MAFGGYKFKGYKVVRANLANNTYANWCLLVHQARIKAFMESCALSGAQWQFSKTNGALAFEDYGNVIYRVANANGDYHDYLSFFKYGNEELYYMIATLGESYIPGSTASTTVPVFKTAASFSSRSQTASSLYAVKLVGGMCSALGLGEFNDNGPFATYPAQALACSSCCSDYVQTASSDGSSVSSSTTNIQLATLSTIRVGFATKGKDIVSYNTGVFCVESANGFSGLCDPNDTYGLLKLVLNYNSGSPSESNMSGTGSIVNTGYAEVLTPSGARGYSTSTSGLTLYNSSMCLTQPVAAVFGTPNSKIPFESAYLTSTGVTGASYVSESGIFTKGQIKNELLSVNGAKSSAYLPTVGTTVLGGNLICARTTAYGTTSGMVLVGTITSSSRQTFIAVSAYVGWDPSNPNINDESSWQELSLS